jgi:methyltransferase (TIGR00027 family)
MEDVLPPGVVDATANLLVASGVAGRRAVRFARSKTAVALYLAFDWMMPGQFEGFAHRKAFCERQARKGIEGGARQVLVLGAGFDTLAWRLAPEFPEIRFLEIDHPATARPKIRGIESMGRLTNHELIAVDLGARRLEEALRPTNVWSESDATVIVAEGLLMYLSPQEVGALLEQCAEVTGPGSRIAFTYVGRRHDGAFDAGPWTWLLLRLLEASGEPWRWGVRPDELAAVLDRWGWQLAAEETTGGVRHGVEYYGVAVR